MRAPLLLLVLASSACGAGSADPRPVDVPPSASAASRPPPRKGAAHPVVARFVAALEAGDARAAAAAFAERGVLVRYRGADALGPDAVRAVLAQALGLCKLRAIGVLERDASAAIQLASRCTHPGWSPEQDGELSHLLLLDVADDRVTRASVHTELLPARFDAKAAPVREVEDEGTLTRERADRATCSVDRLGVLLPKDFEGLGRQLWVTPTCSVLHVTLPPPSHAFWQVSCDASPCPRGRRYVDWNGQLLLPFADEVWREREHRPRRP